MQSLHNSWICLPLIKKSHPCFDFTITILSLPNKHRLEYFVETEMSWKPFKNPYLQICKPGSLAHRLLECLQIWQGLAQYSFPRLHHPQILVGGPKRAPILLLSPPHLCSGYTFLPKLHWNSQIRVREVNLLEEQGRAFLRQDMKALGSIYGRFWQRIRWIDPITSKSEF